MDGFGTFENGVGDGCLEVADNWETDLEATLRSRATCLPETSFVQLSWINVLT